MLGYVNRVHHTSMGLTNYISTLGRWVSEGRECPDLAKMFCSKWAEKPQMWQVFTQLQNKLICSILFIKCLLYARPNCSPFLPIYHTVLSSFICLSGQSSTITLPPIKLKDSQRLGPCHINWYIAIDSINIYEWINKW